MGNVIAGTIPKVAGSARPSKRLQAQKTQLRTFMQKKKQQAKPLWRRKNIQALALPADKVYTMDMQDRMERARQQCRLARYLGEGTVRRLERNAQAVLDGHPADQETLDRADATVRACREILRP